MPKVKEPLNFFIACTLAVIAIVGIANYLQNAKYAMVVDSPSFLADIASRLKGKMVGLPEPKLTVTKIVNNRGGGTKEVSDFELSVQRVSAGAVFGRNVTDVTSGVKNTFSEDVYYIREDYDSAYRAAFSASCGIIGPIFNFDGAIISLHRGDDVTCTITNTYVPSPRLAVVKIVDNSGGGTKQVSDFPLFVDGRAVVSGELDTFSTGVHQVSETNEPGYVATFSDVCKGGEITLAQNDDETCFITNTFVGSTCTKDGRCMLGGNGKKCEVKDDCLPPVGCSSPFSGGTCQVGGTFEGTGCAGKAIGASCGQDLVPPAQR